MTDKKHINDSLKNSDKNFNENFTHDKEQIMIDGVDVSKCKSYRDKDGYSYEDEKFITGCCDDAVVLDSYGELMYYRPCEGNNCYFKQLARKTQECEKLTNKNNLLTAEINQIKLLLEGKNTQYNVKVEECKELKNELDLYKTWYRAKHDDVKNYLGRYRKALDEIEKILKDEICEECPGKEGCKAGCKEHQCLDIINKAKGK